MAYQESSLFRSGLSTVFESLHQEKWRVWRMVETKNAEIESNAGPIAIVHQALHNCWPCVGARGPNFGGSKGQVKIAILASCGRKAQDGSFFGALHQQKLDEIGVI